MNEKSSISWAMFRQLRECSICLDSFVPSSIINFLQTIEVPSNLNSTNSSLDMYLKCGLTEEAEKFFDKMVVKNVVSYTIIKGK